MDRIVDEEFYYALHDKVSRDVFEKAEKLAEKEVKLVIGSYRWSCLKADMPYYEQLQDCICNVMDWLAERELSGAGKGVISVSNKGYSESYAIQTQEQLHAELQSAIRRWLSGTGLTSAYAF